MWGGGHSNYNAILSQPNVQIYSIALVSERGEGLKI